MRLEVVNGVDGVEEQVIRLRLRKDPSGSVTFEAVNRLGQSVGVQIMTIYPNGTKRTWQFLSPDIGFQLEGDSRSIKEVS